MLFWCSLVQNPFCGVTVSSLSSCLTRPATVWGDYPGSDSGLRLRLAGQAQTVAQAEPEGQGAICPHAALAPGPTQCGETHGHETPGEERCVRTAR